jgi:hypothetical protein
MTLSPQIHQAAFPLPNWIHLLPAGQFEGIDGRGPYQAADPAAIVARSMARGRVPVDENHAIDLAAPRGEPSPARGWIVEMQPLPDGVWGRVDWTPTGETIVRSGAYRSISPVFTHNSSKSVTAILRASLTNTPNLMQLKSLNSASSAAHLGVHLMALSASMQAFGGGIGPTDAERKIAQQMGQDPNALAAERVRRQGRETAALQAVTTPGQGPRFTAEQLKIYRMMGVDPERVALHAQASQADIAAVARLTLEERDACRELEIEPLDYIACKKKLPSSSAQQVNWEAVEDALIMKWARAQALPELSSLERKYCKLTGVNENGMQHAKKAWLKAEAASLLNKG